MYSLYKVIVVNKADRIIYRKYLVVAESEQDAEQKVINQSLNEELKEKVKNKDAQINVRWIRYGIYELPKLD